jgi:hypothetical protein
MRGWGRSACGSLQTIELERRDLRECSPVTRDARTSGLTRQARWATAPAELENAAASRRTGRGRAWVASPAKWQSCSSLTKRHERSSSANSASRLSLGALALTARSLSFTDRISYGCRGVAALLGVWEVSVASDRKCSGPELRGREACGVCRWRPIQTRASVSFFFYVTPARVPIEPGEPFVSWNNSVASCCSLRLRRTDCSPGFYGLAVLSAVRELRCTTGV